MSYILWHTFALWFLGVLVLGSGVDSLYSRGDPIWGIPLPVFGFTVICLFSVPISVFVYYTLRLYLSCNQSYKLLFSLLAYIQPRQKLHLLQVAQFFTEEHQHAFRFLNGIKITPSSCVGVTGWMLTCSALVCRIE